MNQTSKAHLTPPKRRLIELMQDINFGRITNIPARDGEPELTLTRSSSARSSWEDRAVPARARPG